VRYVAAEVGNGDGDGDGDGGGHRGHGDVSCWSLEMGALPAPIVVSKSGYFVDGTVSTIFAAC
jgi:hypothetical protein